MSKAKVVPLPASMPKELAEGEMDLGGVTLPQWSPHLNSTAVKIGQALNTAMGVSGEVVRIVGSLTGPARIYVNQRDSDETRMVLVWSTGMVAEVL